MPDIVSHTIDSSSPLYNINPENLINTEMEVIVSTMVTEDNGSTSMFMTSYLPEEIVWAWHFGECVLYDDQKGIFKVGRINMMVPDETPWMSAKKINEENQEL